VLFDLTLQQALLRGAAFLFITALHGLALAGIARLLGDKGPQYDARLTVSPVAHLDLLGLVGAIFFQLGWIKPIAIDPAEMRTGRRGLLICVLLSIGAVLVVAMLLLPLRNVALATLPATFALNVSLFINTVLQMSAWFAVFNLLPVPPLTGAHFLVAIRPEWRTILPRLYPYAVGLLAILMVTGILPRLLQPAVSFLAGRISTW
jgi:Zn-dependent protease